jgi:hypothetical protein
MLDWNFYDLRTDTPMTTEPVAATFVQSKYFELYQATDYGLLGTREIHKHRAEQFGNPLTVAKIQARLAK